MYVKLESGHTSELQLKTLQDVSQNLFVCEKEIKKNWSDLLDPVRKTEGKKHFEIDVLYGWRPIFFSSETNIFWKRPMQFWPV